VIVYDRSGQQFINELGGRFPHMIAAGEGRWEEQRWRLRHVTAYKFDDQGHLIFVGHFAAMTLDIGQEADRNTFEARTLSEMSIRELWRRIQGLPHGVGAGYRVELHTKIAIPFAALIFALFAAPLSLIFGQAGAPRGRAVGIILGILLVALYQGTLIWGQMLGRRYIVPPELGPWAPNLLFGSAGLVLMIYMDRLSRIDVWERLRRLFPRRSPLPAILWIALIAMGAAAQENPSLDIRADSLSVSRDWSFIRAEGHVVISYEKGAIEAEQVRATRTSHEIFEIEASGPIAFRGEGLTAQAQRVTAKLRWQEPNRWELFKAKLETATLAHESGTLQAREITLVQQSPTWQVTASGEVLFTEKDRATRAELLALKLRPDAENRIMADSALLENFSGKARFENSLGATHTIRYEGRIAHALFQENRMQQLEISQGAFTTCGCEALITRAAYSLQADRVTLYTDRLLIATNITVRAFGWPIFWSPIYLAPLKEEQKNPILPEIGQSPTRGWFARWRIPFYLDERNTGFLSIDYFSRRPEVGTGIDFNYFLLAHRGRLHFYRLVGYGDSFALDWNHRSDLPWGLSLTTNISGRTGLLQQDATKIFAHLHLAGVLWGVRWSVSGSREQYLIQPEDEEITYSILEKLPEFSLAHTMPRLLRTPLGYSFSISYGRFREKKLHSESLDESARLDGNFSLRLSDLALGPLAVRAQSSYRFSLYGENQRREAYEISPGLTLRPLENLTLGLEYAFRRVAGGSPFNFDKLDVLNRFTGRANWRLSAFSGTLTTSYDLLMPARPFTPLFLTVGYQSAQTSFLSLSFSLSISLEAQYDLNDPQLRRLAGRAALRQTTAWNLTAYTGYCLEARESYCTQNYTFDDLIVKFAMDRFRLGASVDLHRLSFQRINAETDLALGEQWELSLKGEYDFYLKRFSAWQFGLIRKFCHNCWQLGLYSDGDQIWLQARITAFPMAQIEYSPTDQELSFGRR
jgi:hypothetical protein